MGIGVAGSGGGVKPSFWSRRERRRERFMAVMVEGVGSRCDMVEVLWSCGGIEGMGEWEWGILEVVY